MGHFGTNFLYSHDNSLTAWRLNLTNFVTSVVNWKLSSGVKSC
jgi:hypothetical protein